MENQGVRFEHDKMVLWYGTADALAPSGAVTAAADNQAVVTITAAVQPRSVSNSVQVVYRVNGGELQNVAARQSRQDPVNKVHHFSAELPPANLPRFHVG